MNIAATALVGLTFVSAASAAESYNLQCTPDAEYYSGLTATLTIRPSAWSIWDWDWD